MLAVEMNGTSATCCLVLLCSLAACGGAGLSDSEVAALTRSRVQIGQHWSGSQLYDHQENPFLQPIPVDAVVHENSEAMIELIRSQTGPSFTNTFLSTGDYSIPVYLADDTTPGRDIAFHLYGHPPGMTHMTDVPVLPGSAPAPGSDRHYTVIDEDARCAYELWLFEGSRAGGGNAHPLDGVGIYEDGRSSVAAGWSALQGIIWPSELREGHIPHALSFAVPVTNADGYVAPATKNDGALSGHASAIPEGTRVRIRPDFDLDSLVGIGPVERAVYEALQTYGMYCGDTNGSGVSIRAISPLSVDADAFPAALDTDNPQGLHYLTNFPFDALEVLASGPLTPSEPRDYVDHGCAEWR